MDQYKRQKKIAVLYEDYIDVTDLPYYYLGDASLGDILKAEESAEVIGSSDYDYFYNSCAHYAQRIWRSLGFEETKELADFFVDNIIDDVEGMKIAKKGSEVGRNLRAIAAIAVGGYKSYLESVVYPQLDLN